MAGTGRKWAIGCGIGCGLMLLILGGVGTCSFFAFRDLQEQAEGMDADFEQIRDTFGEAADFVPNPDGTIDDARMLTFLAVREGMAAKRAEVSDLLGLLDGDANWLAKTRAGLKMVPALLGFITERNRVLLAEGMGVGEYQYIYNLSYHVMLQKDPGDGPAFMLTSDDSADDSDQVKLNWGSEDEEATREHRVRVVRHYANELHAQILENQLQAFTATLPAGADPADDPWGAQLVAEIRAMRDESLRFPWEEGLPEPLRSSLEPYRDRLGASYDPMTSVVELGLADED